VKSDERGMKTEKAMVEVAVYKEFARKAKASGLRKPEAFGER
jgi:hypothetical protein